MSLSDEMRELRLRRQQAFISLQGARATLDNARKACTDFLKAYPPKMFRLQEAYQNPDGTYATPHWDETSNYKPQSLIDYDELDQHIIAEGEWTEVYHNEEDDPRPGYRRVIEVTW